MTWQIYETQIWQDSCHPSWYQELRFTKKNCIWPLASLISTPTEHQYLIKVSLRRGDQQKPCWSVIRGPMVNYEKLWWSTKSQVCGSEENWKMLWDTLHYVIVGILGFQKAPNFRIQNTSWDTRIHWISFFSSRLEFNSPLCDSTWQSEMFQKTNTRVNIKHPKWGKVRCSQTGIFHKTTSIPPERRPVEKVCRPRCLGSMDVKLISRRGYFKSEKVSPPSEIDTKLTHPDLCNDDIVRSHTKCHQKYVCSN